MFFQLRHRCPYCGNVVDFQVTQISEVVHREPDPARPIKLKPVPPIHRINAPKPIDVDDLAEGCGLSRCPLCAGPAMIVFFCPTETMEYVRSGRPKTAEDRVIPPELLMVVATYPETPTHQAHPTWPLKIQAPFVDLQAMLEEHRHPSFIISGCRTILDVATRELGATESTPLVKRIDELAAKNIVTGVLREWAHELRIDGNAAVHELEGDERAARQMVEFIKLFLHVTFELPAAIHARSSGDAPAVSGDLVAAVMRRSDQDKLSTEVS